MIKELAGTCRCIAPDYPGFGFSEHPPVYGYTPPEHAQWIAALIDYLRLDGFILVVQDWGVSIGLSVAVDRPETHEKREYHNARLREFCDRNVIPLADIHSHLRDDHFGDELHPNEAGARIIAQRVFEVLRRVHDAG